MACLLHFLFDERRMMKDEWFGLSSPVIRRRSLDYRLDALSKLAAWHKNLAITGETACPDVGAQSDHAPFVAAARVRFTHSNHVVKTYFSGVNHYNCCSRIPEE